MLFKAKLFNDESAGFFLNLWRERSNNNKNNNNEKKFQYNNLNKPVNSFHLNLSQEA